ncbi:Methyltransferase domain protein [anaerobic digester metagenome]
MNQMRSEYQEGYSQINPAVLNLNGRRDKADKIQLVLDDYFKNDRNFGIIVDIGCSGGIILHHLKGNFRKKIGIDIDFEALKKAKHDYLFQDIDFICADGMNLPFRNNSTTLYICNHVCEHLPDSKKLYKEIYRTLKSGGVSYCAAGNALSIMEGHYHHLPFLSWVPKGLGHRYLRLMNRGDYYYEKHLTWWSLKKIISMFRIHDYTIRIIREPELFAGTDLIKPGSYITRMPKIFLTLLFPLIPTWILILEKPRVDQD